MLQDLVNGFVRPLPKSPIYKERLRRELRLIRERKFIKVFMQVKQILDLTIDIPHVIRGSAGSSLVCYLLGITDIDPIYYNISLARFMHEERSDNPDIDIDFPYNKREEVFSRIYGHFGMHRVARISNHLYFKEKSALREAVRMHGYRKQYSKHDDLVELLGEEKVQEVVKTASRLYKRFRGYSLHCGGIVIFDNRIPEKWILEGNQITLNKDQVEDKGLIKIDILSNRALAQLNDLDNRKLTEYPEEDELTSELLSSGNNMGITIAESPAMRKIFTSMKPKNRMDVAFALALLRPAAAAEGNKDKILNGHDPVLVFDDDAIDRFQDMLGCSEAEADNYRRAFAKNKEDKIQELLARVSSEEDKKLIYDNFRRLSLYSFCKCLDGDTVLVDPTTGESTTIEALHDNFRSFKLLSYRNGNIIPDEVINIHFNGYQQVLKIEFNNGIEHTVTEGHRFMTECGEMKTAMEIYKCGLAVKNISDCMTESEKNEQTEEVDTIFRNKNRGVIHEELYLRTNTDGHKHEAVTQYNYESGNEVWRKESIQNESRKYSKPPLFRENRQLEQSLLARSFDVGWLHPHTKSLCKLTITGRGPRISRTIRNRFELHEKNGTLQKVDENWDKIPSEANNKQQKDCDGLSELRCNTEEVDERSRSRYCPYITFYKRNDRRRRLHCCQFKRIPDNSTSRELSINVESKINTYRQYEYQAMQNISKKHERTLLHRMVRFRTMQEDMRVSLQRCKEIPEQKKNSSRCYIKSVKYIGIRPTYSPEMKSEQHNYITQPVEGQVIHANSHAISYGQLVWALAYQKARKPKEFWLTALNHCESMYAKWVFYRHAVAAGLKLTLGSGPWYLEDDTVKCDKPEMSCGPISDYYHFGYWITDEFLDGCYYEEKHEDDITYVRFRGLVATYRRYTGIRKNIVNENADKSYQVTFVTIGHDNDKMLDLVLYGRPKVGKFNIVEGIGIKKTWCNTTHIQVNKYKLSNP